MGAMGTDGNLQLFRPGEKPPPIRVIELPADEDANG